jgi:hypothetical protein
LEVHAYLQLHQHLHQHLRLQHQGQASLFEQEAELW